MPFFQEVIITENVTLNYFSILLAALAYILFGILWYSPLLFGNRFIKYEDEQRYQEKPASLFCAYLGEVVISFIISSGLAFFIALSGVGAYGGMVLAFLVWICFVATTHFSVVLWSRKTGNFYIHSGFTFLGFILMGLTLGWLN